MEIEEDKEADRYMYSCEYALSIYIMHLIECFVLCIELESKKPREPWKGTLPGLFVFYGGYGYYENPFHRAGFGRGSG